MNNVPTAFAWPTQRRTSRQETEAGSGLILRKASARSEASAPAQLALRSRCCSSVENGLRRVGMLAAVDAPSSDNGKASEASRAVGDNVERVEGALLATFPSLKMLLDDMDLIAHAAPCPG